MDDVAGGIERGTDAKRDGAAEHLDWNRSEYRAAAPICAAARICPGSPASSAIRSGGATPAERRLCVGAGLLVSRGTRLALARRLLGTASPREEALGGAGVSESTVLFGLLAVTPISKTQPSVSQFRLGRR